MVSGAGTHLPDRPRRCEPLAVRRLLAALALVSCSPPPSPVPPPAPTESPAPPPPSATASAAAAQEPAAPVAKLGAPIDGRLVEIARCPGGPYQFIHLHGVGKGYLGLCGFALDSSAAFYLGESGPPRLAPEVFKDLPMRETEQIGITALSGPDLDHLRVDVTTLLTRTGHTIRFEKNGARWKKLGQSGFTGGDYCPTSCPEVGGHEIEERPDERGALRFRGRDGRPGWLPAHAKAPGCDTEVGGFMLLEVVGKDLWGLGNACGKFAAQRWTIGGSDTEIQVLDAAAPSPEPALLNGGMAMFVAGAWLYHDPHTRTLLRFDGKRWSSLGVHDAYVHAFDLRGQIWVRYDAGLRRLEGDRLVAVPVPEEGIEHQVVGPHDELRIHTKTGVYAWGADEAWHPVTLPPGSSDLRVAGFLGGRWMYQRTEGEVIHLYLEGGSGPPVVITNPGPILSPMVRVTPLRSACKQPFAMIYKLSKVAPADYDFPATKKALAGEPELSAGRFHEVAAFGERYLVARYDGAKDQVLLAKLAQVIKAKVQGSSPQLLCADEVPGGLPAGREVKMR